MVISADGSKSLKERHQEIEITINRMIAKGLDPTKFYDALNDIVIDLIKERDRLKALLDLSV